MDVKIILCALGLVLIIEGLPYFAFPRRIKAWLRQVMVLPESTLRALGFAAMVGGLVLVYLGRS